MLPWASTFSPFTNHHRTATKAEKRQNQQGEGGRGSRTVITPGYLRDLGLITKFFTRVHLRSSTFQAFSARFLLVVFRSAAGLWERRTRSGTRRGPRVFVAGAWDTPRDLGRQYRGRKWDPNRQVGCRAFFMPGWRVAGWGLFGRIIFLGKPYKKNTSYISKRDETLIIGP